MKKLGIVLCTSLLCITPLSLKVKAEETQGDPPEEVEVAKESQMEEIAENDGEDIEIVYEENIELESTPIVALAAPKPGGGDQPTPSQQQSSDVYVYAENSDDLDGVRLNDNGYYTIGKVSVKGLSSPHENPTTSEQNKVVNSLDNIEYYDSSSELTVDDFTNWKLKYVNSGAADYVPSGDTWHLDGQAKHTHHYTTTTQPTCTTEGVATCSCGATISIAALGHSWGEWQTTTTPATCTEAGETVTYRVCTRDSSHVESSSTPIEALGHNWGEWVETSRTEPTCTMDGKIVYTRTCLRDSSHTETKEEVIPSLGHSVVTDSGYGATCTTSGLTDGSHCSRCNEVLVPQETIPALGHDYGEWEETSRVEATCEESGKVVYTRVCSRDESHIETKEEVLEPTGHEAKEVAAVDPTCTTDGLTKGSICAKCNKVLVSQEKIPALGHDMGEWITVKEATTSEEGKQERKCSRGDLTESRPIPKKEEEKNTDTSVPTTYKVVNTSAKGLTDVQSTIAIVAAGFALLVSIAAILKVSKR